MIDIEAFRLAFAMGLLFLTAFCANMLLIDPVGRRTRLPLATFFGVYAVSLLPLPLFYFDPSNRLGFFHTIIEFMDLPLSMSMPFLFWFYVRGITSECDAGRLQNKLWHFLPIGLSYCAVAAFLLLPADVHEALSKGYMPNRPYPILVGWAVNTLAFGFYLIVALYTCLTVRLLLRYSARLKDLFASTEGRELKWICWIAIAAGIFCLIDLAGLSAGVFGLETLRDGILNAFFVEAFLQILIIWTLALWGLRQQPGLLKTPPSFQPAQPTAPEAKTYQKSALTSDRAKRIAQKIHAAMISDRLYRDPNLSLWDLASHVGVTPNYVSQTLNGTVGESFFDYINRWRIKEAAVKLQASEETILAITYDVGFNSRSSFYKAFRREMGTTPSDFRRQKSMRLVGDGVAP